MISWRKASLHPSHPPPTQSYRRRNLRHSVNLIETFHAHLVGILQFLCYFTFKNSWPRRYHQRYSQSVVGSRVAGSRSGRRLVMPPGASIGPLGSSARHSASTPILNLDYSAKVRNGFNASIIWKRDVNTRSIIFCERVLAVCCLRPSKTQRMTVRSKTARAWDAVPGRCRVDRHRCRSRCCYFPRGRRGCRNGPWVA